MTKKDSAATALLRCSPIKIGPDYYRVKIVPEMNWIEEGENKSNIGVLSFIDHEIRIRGDIRGYALLDTIFHECLHAIWADRLDSPLEDSTAPTQEIQETIICSYEAGIPALFLDNPKLLKLFNHYWQPTARKRKD